MPVTTEMDIDLPSSKVDSKSLCNDSKSFDTISWSRNGFIAYSIPSLISKHNLYLTYLENVNGKSWQLAKPQRFSIKPSLEGNSLPELSMVTWSNLSTDLAVTDIYGNFYILLAGVGLISGNSDSNKNTPAPSNGASSINGTSANGSNSSPSYELTSYNHLEMIYRDIINNQLNQRPNKSAQFIAFKWLPIEKAQILNKAAKLVKLSNGNKADGENSENSHYTNSFAYSYGVYQYQPSNLCHPISTKQACIALRSNGELILYYQGEHKVEYHRISKNINENFNYNLNIEHAAFGFPEGRKIILVAYDSLSGKIRTYSIEINWGFLVDSANKQKVDPHYNTPKELQKRPTLSCTLIHEMLPMIENEFDSVPAGSSQSNLGSDNMDGAYPLDVKSESKNNEDDMDMDMEMDMDMDMNIDNQLASLNDNSKRIESSKEEQKEYKPKQRLGKLSSIHIRSLLSSENPPLDIMLGYEYCDENLKVSTTYHRYKIVSNSSLISSSFSEIGAKKGVVDESNSANGESSLLFQDKIVIPKRVVSLNLGGCLSEAICEDGEIVTIENTVINFVPVDNKKQGEDPYKVPELISNLYLTGFVLPQLEISGKNPIIVAYSPNKSAVAYTEINEDTDLNLKLVFSRKENYSTISPEELYLTSVGLAFHHAFACYLNSCSDDLLVLIQTEVERISKLIANVIPDKEQQLKSTDSFIESIICESHKAINFQLDMFSRESVDKLLSNPPLQKLLSLQLILGDLDARRNKVSKNIAWIILNLRSTSFGIMFLLSSIYRQISKKKPAEDSLQDSITRAESIISLTGNVRWLVELLIYLNQEMLQLYISRKDPGNSKVNFSNSIVLPILLSKVPRLFLMYALSSIGKTHEVLKKLNDDLSKGNKLFAPMKDAFNRYFTACSNSPLNLNLYENFIRDCDNYITKEMNDLTTKTSKNNILRLEQKLVCQGKVSDEILKYGQWIIAKHASLITKDLKVAEKFYYDLDWIDIGFKKFYIENDMNNHAKPILGNKYFQYTTEMIPRHYYKKGEYVDALRKVLIDLKTNTLGLRKCTRCRSLSLINDPLVFSHTSLGLWTMVFQRTCVCGSAWVNVE